MDRSQVSCACENTSWVDHLFVKLIQRTEKFINYILYWISCHVLPMRVHGYFVKLIIHGLLCDRAHNCPLRWRHNGRDNVSNHQPHHCLLNRLFRRWSKKTSKLRVTGLCVRKSPGTGDFPAQMAINAENVLMTSSCRCFVPEHWLPMNFDMKYESRGMSIPLGTWAVVINRFRYWPPTQNLS